MSEKADEIIEKLLELANEGKTIRLEKDFGGNTLTIFVGEDFVEEHTHVGVPDGDFQSFLDSFHALLVKGRGLSWAKKPGAIKK